MRIGDLREQFYREIILILAGLLFVGAGIVWIGFGKTAPEMEIISAGMEETKILNASASAELAVDVSGAVMKPGVYYFRAGQRVGDALEAVGGISEKADSSALGKSINQAEKLRDGQKIYILSKSESLNTNNQTNSNPLNPNEKVNINGASQAELEALPGIGPATAQKIISGRPYGEITELVNKKILGTKVFEQIREQLQTW